MRGRQYIATSSQKIAVDFVMQLYDRGGGSRISGIQDLRNCVFSVSFQVSGIGSSGGRSWRI